MNEWERKRHERKYNETRQRILAPSHTVLEICDDNQLQICDLLSVSVSAHPKSVSNVFFCVFLCCGEGTRNVPYEECSKNSCVYESKK